MTAETITAANKQRNRAEVTYLGQNAVIGMAFTFNQYTYNPAASLNTGTIDFRTNTGNVTAMPANTIVFPLPKQLVDNISLNVAGKEIGTLGALTAGVINRPGDIGQDVINTLTGIRNQAQSVVTGDTSFGDLISQGISGANYLVRSGLGSIAPQISQGIEAALGEAVNPHQTLTFDGVTLKQHTFSFEFAPRNDKESRYIALALNRMKGYALPRYKNPVSGENNPNSEGVTNSGVLSRGLLEYPKTCQVNFVAPGIDPAFFYTMKPSMISNISIDYTPQGNSLLRGGRPAFINVSITLVEQAIHTAADYDTPDETLGGA